MTGNGTIEGKVKWFNGDKGFGFIEIGGGIDVFVHANQLRKSGIDRPLLEGEKLRFSTDKGPKGNFAVNISLVNGTSPEGASP